MASIDTRRPCGSLTLAGADRAWRRVGHVSGVNRVESREVIDIRVEDRDLDQMIHRCPSGFQDGCEILERLFRLCLDTVGRHSGSGIDARGTRAKDKATRGDRLTIGAERGWRLIAGYCLPRHRITLRMFCPLPLARRLAWPFDSGKAQILRAGPHNNFRSLLESPTTFLDMPNDYLRNMRSSLTALRSPAAVTATPCTPASRRAADTTAQAGSYSWRPHWSNRSRSRSRHSATTLIICRTSPSDSATRSRASTRSLASSPSNVSGGR